MSTTNTTTSGDPWKGISGAYKGDSLAIIIYVSFCGGLAVYNSLELLVLIFFTFRKYRGLYFWSLLVSSFGVMLYSIGFAFKELGVTKGKVDWLSITFITIGWYGMITGESVVLWSRLHLLLENTKGRRTLKWTKWMIITNVVILHFPTTVLTYGSNGYTHVPQFVKAYSIMERIQMIGFFLQETILSSLYIMSASQLIKNSIRKDAKSFFSQLLTINVVIIIMDIAIVAVECAGFYIAETIVKGVVYSIKLKLEFAILGQLIRFVGARPDNTASYGRHQSTRRSVAGPTSPMSPRHHSDSKTELFDGIGHSSDVVALHKFDSPPPAQLRASTNNPAFQNYEFGTRHIDNPWSMAKHTEAEGITITDHVQITRDPRPQLHAITTTEQKQSESDDSSVDRFVLQGHAV